MVSLHAALSPEWLTKLTGINITEEKSMVLDQVQRTVQRVQRQQQAEPDWKTSATQSANFLLDRLIFGQALKIQLPLCIPVSSGDALYTHYETSRMWA